MLVAVLLGKRLNDDASPHPTLIARLQLCLQFVEKFHPDKIILSGGVANKRAGKSEGQFMFDYLVAQGVDSNMLVVEEKSMTTRQNAIFSIPLAVQSGATQIAVITSNEHMSRWFLNPIKLFARQLKRYANVQLFAFSGDQK